MSERFKPLWRIHNSTYRKYAKGARGKRIEKYKDRLYRILKLKSRQQTKQQTSPGR